MARTPIPPRASADRNRRKSDRRNRCAMLIFSCFLFRTMGPVEVVLADCTTQRYRIVSPKATPARKSSVGVPKTEDDRLQHSPTLTRHARESGNPRVVRGLRQAPCLLVATLHGGYTVKLWVRFVHLS